MQRRDFLKLSATAGAVSCVTACGGKSSENVTQPTPPLEPVEQKHWYSCIVNCNASCPIKVITQDGTVTRIEAMDTAEKPEDNHICCLRGRAARQKIYAPERIATPLRRTGPRGSGQYEPISWDEALDTIHEKLSQTISNYGNQSIYFIAGSGAIFSTMSGADYHSGGNWVGRLMNLRGGHLGQYYGYSFSSNEEATRITTGTSELFGSNLTEALESDLFLGMGFNPCETHMGADTSNAVWQRIAAKDNIEKIIVDPKYTDSSLGKESRWIPIRTGTDGAFMEALAYEIINDERFDETFINKHAIGFDDSTMPAHRQGQNLHFKAHILGDAEDGVAKTPEYAEGICGVPAATIREIAQKLLAADKPFINLGLGPNRQANGESTVRMAMILPFLLGKVGIPGTNNGLCHNHMHGLGLGMGPAMLFGEEFALDKSENNPLYVANPVEEKISFYTWNRAIEHGTKMTRQDGVRGGEEKLNTNIKFIWSHASNTLINQHADAYENLRLLKDESLVEFIVAHDVNMTPSTRMADIILPDLMDIEAHDDIGMSVGHQTSHFIPVRSKVKPSVDGRTPFDIGLGLAQRAGLEAQYTAGMTYQQWVEFSYAQTVNFLTNVLGHPKEKFPESYEEFIEGDPITIPSGPGSIALAGYINQDPTQGPTELATPSGKVEFYSERLQVQAETWVPSEPGEDKDRDHHWAWTAYDAQMMPSIPKHVVTWESSQDEETKKEYPLQIYGFHSKGRAHSSFHNLPWLREVYQDAVWIHPNDAAKYNVKDGQDVIISSKRGKIKIVAKVTPRIIEGVTCIPQGQWFKDFGETGIDEGACINTLTCQRPTPSGKGSTQHTTLVKIEPA